MMENNRYREEEKELEQEQPLEEKIEEAVQEEVSLDEKKVDDKKNKKLKKKIEGLNDEISELKDQIAQLQDQLLRNQAELENFKRRTNEERIKERKYAMQDFFSEIVDVVDIFDKAVNVKTEDEKLKKFLSGFTMVNGKLKQNFESYGMKKIESLNKPFDPSVHQAMETVKVEGVEPNIVVEVVIDGYIYKDRVLRPSMVKVSE